MPKTPVGPPGASPSGSPAEPLAPGLLARLTAIDPELSEMVTEIIAQTVEGFVADIYKTWPARPADTPPSDQQERLTHLWWQCNFAVIHAQTKWLDAVKSSPPASGEPAKE